MSKLADKIREMAEEVTDMGVDVDFRESYSGRCMYDKTCVGVVVADTCAFLSFFAPLARAVDEDDLDALTNVRQDSMGRKTIFYWPGISADNEEDEDEQGQSGDEAGPDGAGPADA